VNALICDLKNDKPPPRPMGRGPEGYFNEKSAKFNIGVIKSLFINIKVNNRQKRIVKRESDKKTNQCVRDLKKATGRGIGMITTQLAEIRHRGEVLLRWILSGEISLLIQSILISGLLRIDNAESLRNKLNSLDFTEYERSVVNYESCLLLIGVFLLYKRIKCVKTESQDKHGNQGVYERIKCNESVKYFNRNLTNLTLNIKECELVDNKTLKHNDLYDLYSFTKLVIRNSMSCVDRTFYDYPSSKIIVTTTIIMALIITLLLLKQTVEPNPGPTNNIASIPLVTYNCNGLGNITKLRRLLNKVETLVNKNGIIFLQETHIVDTTYLKLIWKNNFISNCIKTNSAGVIILFSNEMKIIEKMEDEEGRLIVAVLESEESRIIASNAYFPNDHKTGIKFSEKLYLMLLKMQAKYPEHVTICAGDYNVCMTNNDQMYRNRSKN
jgi:hypothetical protein